MINYDNISCIRNSYYHNSCQECVDICPEDLFLVRNNRIAFDSSSCTLCSACVGSCPTESIAIDDFDPNLYALQFKFREEKTLSCRTNSPCLSAFSSETLLSMVLNGDSSIECDLTACSECEIGNLKETIIKNIDSANISLSELGLESKLTVVENLELDSKRGIFSKIYSKISKDLKISEADEFRIASILRKADLEKKSFPTKQKVLVELLRERVEEFENAELSNHIYSQSIEHDKCTNCGDCMQFCPTDALFPSSDKLSIFLNPSKCIECGNCNHICKTDAIKRDDKSSVIDVALRKSNRLVNFTMRTCTECKMPFIDKGEEICDRCIDFKTNFNDMFTLAKDV